MSFVPCQPLADPGVAFFGGGGGGILVGDPSHGTLKTKNSTDLGHYFLGWDRLTTGKISDLPPIEGRGSPKIMKNMTEVDIFMQKKNVRF